jgi:hypothetical protein
MDATQRDPRTIAGPGSVQAASPDSLHAAAGGLPGLTEQTLSGDPMTQFARWMADAEARRLPEPTAMVLATVSAEGRPRARTVLLKEHGQPGFTFYTNRTSRKGQVLPVQAAPVADRGLGQQAVAGHRVARGTRRPRR